MTQRATVGEVAMQTGRLAVNPPIACSEGVAARQR